MQKNRIVLAITAIVVIALLFVGAGYAFSGDARTYNQGDQEKLEYMSITPADFTAIFNDETIFDTYVYDDSGTKTTAYAFDGDEVVDDLTVDATNYKAVKLGSKYMTVLNQTGGDISALKFTVKATGAVGNSDFVFIFKLSTFEAATAWAADTVYYEKASTSYIVKVPQPESGDSVEGLYTENVTGYLVYDGSTSENVTLSIAVVDTENVDVNVNVYVGYVPNVYVPNTYIGPAADAQTGHEATIWTEDVTYYTDAACQNPADPQPANQAALDAGTFYESYLPYKQSTIGPVDLATTSFGIEVVDASS